LENYFLLDPSFNLNISRVAGLPNPKTRGIYLYNKDKDELIYSSKSLKDIARTLGIGSSVVYTHIYSQSCYLANYYLTTYHIATPKPVAYSEIYIQNMFAKDRNNTTSYLYNKDKSGLYFSGLNKDLFLLSIYSSTSYFVAYPLKNNLLFFNGEATVKTQCIRIYYFWENMF
jgi:hypothetical protein